MNTAGGQAIHLLEGPAEEDRAGAEGDRAAVDGQGTLAAGHEYQRVEGEVRAVDQVVGLTVLAAALDDNQRLDAVARTFQIEAVGLVHLAREEVRNPVSEFDSAHHGDGQ